ncbi:MAG: hypothetical protein ACLFPD_01610 [Desulfosudaceae bacterium]
MAVAMLVLAALSLSSLLALTMVLNDSAMMRNNRDYRRMLYRAETGLALAAQTHRTTWLAPDSVLFDEDDPQAVFKCNPFTLADKQGNSLPALGRYRIARIQSAPAAGSLSARFYDISHRAPLTGRAGFSARDFELRRYGIRSTGFDQRGRDGVTIEAGLAKVFNRL